MASPALTLNAISQCFSTIFALAFAISIYYISNCMHKAYKLNIVFSFIMIKFLKIISNSFKSDLCMYFTYIAGGSSIPNGKYFRRFAYRLSIIYKITLPFFHREKTAKNFYFSHFLMMNILKNAILNMNIFILRKFQLQKQSGIAKNFCKSSEKKMYSAWESIMKKLTWNRSL